MLVCLYQEYGPRIMVLVEAHTVELCNASSEPLHKIGVVKYGRLPTALN